MSKTVKIGLVGCGKISGIYLQNLTGKHDHVEVVACADLVEANAMAAAEAYHIPRVMTFDEMLAWDEIDLILNLTVPRAHFEITKKALSAGKHVYSEKPLAITFAEGEELCRIAEEKGLCLGCAPDTFMGAGIQTAKQCIDSGKTGNIIGGNAFMMCHGHESWHPNPEFYYEVGGGPVLDMGPYYLTALVNLLGPIREVQRMTAKASETRTITSQPKAGKQIKVETPTHICGLLRFVSGAICTVTMSFDVWRHSMPHIELYGTKGSLRVPDPNNFGGEVLLSQANAAYESVPPVSGCVENSRGLGVADMADRILGKKADFAANGRTALHVLEAMCALIDETPAAYEMKTGI